MKIKKLNPAGAEQIIIAQGLVAVPFELDSELNGETCSLAFEVSRSDVWGGGASDLPPVVTIDPQARYADMRVADGWETEDGGDPVTASQWLQAQREDLADPIKAFHRDNQQPSTGSLPIYTEVRNDMAQPTPTPAPRLDLIEDEDGAPLSEEQQELFGDIGDWWADVTAEDAAGCVAKAIEYGSADLDVMATGMIAIASPKWDEAPLEEQMKIGREMALGFYLMGKIGRITGALKQGRLPSDDTLKDITVYSMMLRYVRAHGAWA